MLYSNVQAEPLHVIDFGLAQPYKEEGTGVHLPNEHRGDTAGTPEFMSRHAHTGHQQSRRDDIESLAYVLVYLWKGRLPWSGAEKERVQLIKERSLVDEICKGAECQALRDFVYTARSLRFAEAPPYDY